MKRSFSTFKRPPSLPTSSTSTSIQPDFNALDIVMAWEPSEFSLLEHDTISSAGNSKDGKMMTLYLEDQMCQFPSGYDFLGGKSKSTKHRYNSVSTDEMIPHDEDCNCYTGSCCASMCCTLASTALTVASSTFSTEFSEEPSVCLGSASSVGMDKSTSATRLTFPEHPSRNTKLGPLATPASSQAPAPSAANVTIEAVATDDDALAAADAAVNAACRRLLDAIQHRNAVAATTTANCSGRAASPCGLEPFSLGPGRPDA
jgi:hypothetical protein